MWLVERREEEGRERGIGERKKEKRRGKKKVRGKGGERKEEEGRGEEFQQSSVV